MSLPRRPRQSRSLNDSRSRPANSSRSALTWDLPPVSPTRVRAVTLLPEPDSPTIARHSPGASEKEAPWTISVTLRFSPKPTRRFSTRSRSFSGSAGRRPPLVIGAGAMLIG